MTTTLKKKSNNQQVAAKRTQVVKVKNVDAKASKALQSQIGSPSSAKAASNRIKSVQLKLNFPPCSSTSPSKTQITKTSAAISSSTKTPPPNKSAVVTAAKKTPAANTPAVKTSATKVLAAKKTDNLPRISIKLTLSELKLEAKCRGLELKNLPKTKADLLVYLGDNSIHVKETEIYKSYKALLERMESEKEGLRAQSEKEGLHVQSEMGGLTAQPEKETLHVQSEKNNELQQVKRKARGKSARKQIEEEREAFRMAEIASQTALHTHSCPNVHIHPLALTKELKFNGWSRKACCSVCYGGSRVVLEIDPSPCMYTCEICDWDICQKCFQLKNMSSEERAAYDAKIRKEQEVRKREQAEKQRIWKEEMDKRETEENIRWDATQQFKSSIIMPPVRNKSIGKKGFIVWCTDAHIDCDGPSNKMFDTIWTTAKDANDRARYLFYWKNCYEIEPNEMYHDELSTREGLNTYFVHFSDSHMKWTVGVVPASAFLHLPNAVSHRHYHDDNSPKMLYSELSY